MMANKLRQCFIPCILASMLLMGFPAWMATAEEDHDTARRMLESGEILPLEDILASIRKDYPGKVLEVELERKSGRVVYEIEILAEDGVVRELYVDASNANVIKAKIDD